MLLIFRFCKQENWIILKSTWYVYMCLFYVLIIDGKFPWIVFIKKKVETNVKSHLNQLILTIVTINQFRLLLNINIALYFTCIGALCLFYIWGINIYLIFFFNIANFMKICQICLNWMFISLKKNDGIGSLFERSDAFQCCMFSSTLGSLVILVHLVKNLILL